MGTKYYFDSFADSSASNYYGSGTVVTTGQKQGDYAEVKVTADNNHSDFVGRTFWVEADAKTDGSEIVQLYTDEGSTATGVYVKIYATAPTRSVSFTVNDGTDPLQGASVVIDEGTAKTTGSSGGCTASLTDGNHSVKVTKDGYVDYTGTIIVDYENLSFTISLDEDTS